MWIQTPYGFTSAVAHRKKRDSLMVRARDIEALEYFCDQADVSREKIHTKFPSDYPYRVVVKRTEYENYVIGRVRAIDYDNFKNAASRVWGYKDKYLTFLHRVWAEGHILTPKDVAKKNSSTKTVWTSDTATGRWSSSGAWGAQYTHSTITPPAAGAPAAVTTSSSDDDSVAASIPTTAEIIEMTPQDRSEALLDLEEMSRQGDALADDVLNEWNRMREDLGPDDDGDELPVSVHNMTDEQFAKHEADGI